MWVVLGRRALDGKLCADVMEQVEVKATSSASEQIAIWLPSLWCQSHARAMKHICQR